MFVFVYRKNFTSSHCVKKLEARYQSVKGIGRSEPNPKSNITLENGCVVPTGKLIESKEGKNSSLLYNEYIVYNVDQIKQRYLVNVNFNQASLF